MKIIILNFILSTPINGKIISRESNCDTMIYNMARGFSSLGHEVTLLASEEYKPLKPEENDFKVVYFPSRFKRIFKPTLLPYPKGLVSFLKKETAEVDMVLAIETFSIPTLIASLICPKKMLIWQEVGVYQRMAFKIPAKLWCHVVARLTMSRIPIVAMSPGARSFAEKFMRRVSRQTVAHGADEKVFYPSQEPPGDYFIVVSMLVARKRIDSIIRIFARYVEKYDKATENLVIVGEGPEERNLKALVADLGVSGRVEFKGFLSHSRMNEYERRAKALVVNTASDLNMVSVTEAIANGTPVLMNTVPTTSAFVSQYCLGIAKNGWDEDDMKAMSDNYDNYHSNCVSQRQRFTNTGVAGLLCSLFHQSHPVG